MSNGISCRAKQTCFIRGRRVRAGEKVTLFCGRKEISKNFTVLGDVIEGDDLEDEGGSDIEGIGAGMVQKTDSVTDLSMTDNTASSISKNAQELADEFSINLDDVKGTGVNGQITKGDVQKFIDSNTGDGAI